MPESREIVVNTGPIIALVAGLGDLTILQQPYGRVVAPFEVGQELLADNPTKFGASEFECAAWIEKWPSPVETSPFLRRTLDSGEAAVIELALREGIDTVCIDETMGRRVARLSGLRVTGSLGILVRANREGLGIDIAGAIERMRAKGVWLSDSLVRAVLRRAGQGETE